MRLGYLFLVILALGAYSPLQASQAMMSSVEQSAPRDGVWDWIVRHGPSFYLRLEALPADHSLRAEVEPEFLLRQLAGEMGWSGEEDFQFVRSFTDDLGWQHGQYQQLFKGGRARGFVLAE